MENLKPPLRSIKKRQRVGRGPGSGCGKTCTRGHNGQKSRKGCSIRIGFEGGQTPLYRRLPKRGFKNSRFKKEFNIINLFMLNKFDDNSVINISEYENMGMLSSKKLKVKILGDGEIKKKLEVHADRFSNTAFSKIEKAGGKAVIIK